MTNQTIVSGIQPSGELHLGNYLGALKNFIELQSKYDCYFFIADLHSLTKKVSPHKKSEQIFNLAADFLALGLNPKKAVLFIQSHIPAHAELAWILGCLTPYAELKRMTQFKDKSFHDPQNINLGLLSYPVLQAADILLYKPMAVPVGKDQVQHLEITRKLARWFNKQYSNLFIEPKAMLTPTPNVMSLKDPNKKMSKSHGPESYIALSDELKIIQQKLAGAVTDSGQNQGKSMSPGVANLFLLLENFSTPTTYKKFKQNYLNNNLKYQELKDRLALNIADYFKAYRKAKKDLLKNPAKTIKVFQDGAKQANRVADKTLLEAKKLAGLI